MPTPMNVIQRDFTSANRERIQKQTLWLIPSSLIKNAKYCAPIYDCRQHHKPLVYTQPAGLNVLRALSLRKKN
jgi:hypothetical protein